MWKKHRDLQYQLHPFKQALCRSVTGLTLPAFPLTPPQLSAPHNIVRGHTYQRGYNWWSATTRLSTNCNYQLVMAFHHYEHSLLGIAYSKLGSSNSKSSTHQWIMEEDNNFMLPVIRHCLWTVELQYYWNRYICISIVKIRLEFQRFHWATSHNASILCIKHCICGSTCQRLASRDVAR